jgi:hypothetical protein
METLHEALERLDRFGYTGAFRALPEARLGLRADEAHGRRSDTSYPSDAFVVEEVVRFEGQSDPGDSAVLFALRAPDGARGTFVASYGPQLDAESVAALEGLDANPNDRSMHA